jgi:hypothetical protein
MRPLAALLQDGLADRVVERAGDQGAVGPAYPVERVVKRAHGPDGLEAGVIAD